MGFVNVKLVVHIVTTAPKTFNRLPVLYNSYTHMIIQRATKLSVQQLLTGRQPHAFSLPTLQCAELHCHACCAEREVTADWAGHVDVWRRRETHTEFWWVNVQERAALKTEALIHHINIQFILIIGCRHCAVRGAVTRQASHSARRSDRQCQSVSQSVALRARGPRSSVTALSLTKHTMLHASQSFCRS